MAFLQQKPLFTSGSGGYFRYRIPALVICQSGTILAFCEGRKFTGQDSDQIDILLRRSMDGGSTFENLRCILTDEGWVCGNPAAVVDQTTGVIWLLFCKNGMYDREIQICHGEAARTVWITSSRDDGQTWAEPVDITDSVKQPDWAWYATGPVHGIQLSNGRLVIPCDHSLLYRTPGREIAYYSHVIYSDDHGYTWQIGGSAAKGTNECTVIETLDGLIYLNARNSPRYQFHPDGTVSPQTAAYLRATAWSEDGGISFSNTGYDQALIEPICQASLCRLTDNLRHDRSRVIFANPASRTRENLSLYISYDECHTWPVSRVLHPGFAQYSDLCVTGDLTICCLYERGDDLDGETITFAQLDLSWLEGN